MTKDKVKEQIKKLPEEFTLDELMEHFILLEKIETGDAQSKNGETISNAEMDLKLSQWFK